MDTVGEDVAAVPDNDVPRARQRVHALVRVPGVRPHLLVLLQPAVQQPGCHESTSRPSSAASSRTHAACGTTLPPTVSSNHCDTGPFGWKKTGRRKGQQVPRRRSGSAGPSARPPGRRRRTEPGGVLPEQQRPPGVDHGDVADKAPDPALAPLGTHDGVLCRASTAVNQAAAARRSARAAVVEVCSRSAGPHEGDCRSRPHGGPRASRQPARHANKHQVDESEANRAIMLGSSGDVMLRSASSEGAGQRR